MEENSENPSSKDYIEYDRKVLSVSLHIGDDMEDGSDGVGDGVGGLQNS